MLLQPKAAHRAGLDAVLLAGSATVPAEREMRVLDAGAGSGVVGLCVAARCPTARIVAVEVEPRLAALARRNATRNDLAGRVEVIDADLTRPADELRRLGLAAGSFDVVLANPPFLPAGRARVPRGELKARAMAMAEGGLESWARFLARMAKPGGQLSLVHRADALSEVLAALSGRFGALDILPLQPREYAPAIRILVCGIKGSRAPLRLLPGLALHGADGTLTDAVEAVARDGEMLAFSPADAARRD
jgi:tRNA1(Val) A37 N6-methylase TrmN6